MRGALIGFAALALASQPAAQPTVWSLRESPSGSVLALAGCENCDGGIFTLECRRADGVAALTVFGLYPNGDEGSLGAVVADIDGARHVRTVRLTSWLEIDSSWSAEAVLNLEDPLIDALAEGSALTLSAGVEGGRSGPASLEGARVQIDEWRGLCLRHDEPRIGTNAERPPLVESAGPFTARALPARPALGGPEWIAADVHNGPAPAEIRLGPDASLTLVEPDANVDTGDLQRYELHFRRKDHPDVRIDDNGFTAWVYVTPDLRYVFSEPLYVLDVSAWTQYALHAALEIPNYTNIEAVSRDGKRLIVSRRDCAMDCSEEAAREQFYELILP